MFASHWLFVLLIMFSISISHRVLSFQRVILGASRHQLGCKWLSPFAMTLKTSTEAVKKKPKTTDPPKAKPNAVDPPKVKVKTVELPKMTKTVQSQKKQAKTVDVPKTKTTKIKFPKPRPGEKSRVKPQPKKEEEDVEKDRPFTLPPGLYRPKQSLGQNFLSDQNYVVKIVNAFKDNSEKGRRVLEIGPGAGALTRKLFEQYPDMTAVEIDQRGYEFLSKKLPGLNIINMDILDYDWAQAAVDRGGPLSVIANLPYNIVSQVIFMLADNHKAIQQAVLTMQWEVGARVTAEPNTKEYGIPSVVMQLYGQTKLNFKLPPTVFYPVPKVDSALVTIDFTKPHPDLHKVDGDSLRKVITLSFQHRRKMFRVSLRELCEKEQLVLPEKWSLLRPEQLRPEQFIELTADLYGVRADEAIAPLKRNPVVLAGSDVGGSGSELKAVTRELYSSTAIWRKNMFPDMNKSNKQKAKLERRRLAEEGLDEDGDDLGEEFEDEEEEEVPQWKRLRDIKKSMKLTRKQV